MSSDSTDSDIENDIIFQDTKTNKNRFKSKAETPSKLYLRSKGDLSVDEKYQGHVVQRSDLYDTGHAQVDEEIRKEYDSVRQEIEDGEEQIIRNDEVSVEEIDAEEIVSSIKERRRKDLMKAKAVMQQKELNDAAIKFRILLQKPLLIGNRFPQENDWKQWEKKNPSFEAKFQPLRTDLKNVLVDLVTLQDELLQRRSDVQMEPLDQEVLEMVKESNDIENASKLVDQSFARYKQFREDSLTKWHSKARLQVSGHKRIGTDIMSQVANQLKSMPVLKQRTQVKRFEEPILGKRKRQLDIFDDRDFYQDLLKNLVEERGNQTVIQTNPLTSSWEPPKKKRNFGKSKDRTIRYVTHQEMVGFMAPIPEPELSEHVQVLYKYLFGRPSMS